MCSSVTGADEESKQREGYTSEGGSGGKNKKRTIEQESPESVREELKKRIDSECEAYKMELRALMEEDEFRAGFESNKEWEDCKEYYDGVINGISADIFINSYCGSNDKSKVAVKSDFAKRSTKKKIREDSSRPFQWPICSDNYYYTSGKTGKTSKLRGKGANFDIHHIIPKSFGGGNKASNTIPMHAKNHFDNQGIHAPKEPLNKLELNLMEYKDCGFCDGGCCSSKGDCV